MNSIVSNTEKTSWSRYCMDFIHSKLRIATIIKYFVLILIGAVVLYYSGLDQENYYKQLKLDGFKDAYDAFILLQFALAIGHFNFYVLIVCGINNSFYYLLEKNNGIGNLLISRNSFFHYFMRKSIDTILGTVFIVIGSMILYFIYSSFRWGFSTFNYASLGEKGWVYVNQKAWLIVQLVSYSLFTIIFSLVNISMSRFIKRYQLLFLFPFVSYMTILLVLSIVNSLSWRIGFNFQWAYVLFPLNLTSILLNSVESDQVFIYLVGLMFYLLISIFMMNSTYHYERDNYLSR